MAVEDNVFEAEKESDLGIPDTDATERENDEETAQEGGVSDEDMEMFEDDPNIPTE